MDENDKTYMWLVLITFLALAVACFFSFIEMKELQDPISGDKNNPFASSN